MIQRKKIAIIFNFRKGWMGGVIYIINLINALNFLDDNEKPELIVFYNRDLEEFLKDLQYPYIKAIKWHFPVFWKGYLKSWISGENNFVEAIVKEYRPVGVYPMNDWPWRTKQATAGGTKVVAWFPDLQHKFYPKFFSRRQWWMRELRLRILLRNAGDLVVSSNDVKGHFTRFYKMRKDLQVHVLHFASMVEKAKESSVETLLSKYKVSGDYFMVSNQFHNHKNHPLVLKALGILRKEGLKPIVLFTGKVANPGNEEYVKKINLLIDENELHEQVQLLGIIPRGDQLQLMKNAAAVIQPSLFEGWSTVIEDSISLQVPVIAANLGVNIEQLGEKGFYFDPHKPQELANHIKFFLMNSQTVQYEDYNERVKRFAKTFVKIFE
jgi:glycosyltransferase involved in cell wall biosynthesis